MFDDYLGGGRWLVEIGGVVQVLDSDEYKSLLWDRWMESRWVKAAQELEEVSNESAS